MSCNWPRRRSVRHTERVSAVWRHHLLDRAENGMARRIQHLDPDTIAEFQEWGLRRTAFERLDGAPFGDAGRSHAAVLIGHRARSDNGARAERTRLGGVRDQARKI